MVKQHHHYNGFTYRILQWFQSWAIIKQTAQHRTITPVHVSNKLASLAHVAFTTRIDHKQMLHITVEKL